MIDQESLLDRDGTLRREICRPAVPRTTPGESDVPALPLKRVRVAQVVTGLVLGGGGQVMSTIARNVDRSRFDPDFYLRRDLWRIRRRFWMPRRAGHLSAFDACFVRIQRSVGSLLECLRGAKR